MQRLGIELPAGARSLLEREVELKRLADALEHMLCGLEAAKRMVLPAFSMLLEPLLGELHSLLAPGLGVLGWGSVGAESYASEVLAFVGLFDQTAARVRDLYENRVLRGLRAVARTPLVWIPTEVVGVDGFAAEQDKILRAGVVEMNERSAAIECALRDCVEVVRFSPLATEASRPSPAAVRRFLDEAWERMYLSVLSTVRRASNELKELVRASFGSGPHSPPPPVCTPPPPPVRTPPPPPARTPPPPPVRAHPLLHSAPLPLLQSPPLPLLNPPSSRNSSRGSFSSGPHPSPDSSPHPSPSSSLQPPPQGIRPRFPGLSLKPPHSLNSPYPVIHHTPPPLHSCNPPYPPFQSVS